jgi:hypothetical protein
MEAAPMLLRAEGQGEFTASWQNKPQNLTYCVLSR